MLKNYLTTAWRNLTRHRLFTFLNIFGLALGMTCSILIFLWVSDELSFDKFNPGANSIFRMTCNVSGIDAAVVPSPFAAALRASMPAVKRVTRIANLQKMVTVGNRKFNEKGIYYADTSFLQVFNYPLLIGSETSVLSSPDNVVLTESYAKKYFGSAREAMGKAVYIDNDIKGTTYIVRGVLKDIPDNSHLRFDMLLPMADYDRKRYTDFPWNNFDAYIYFQLGENVPAGAGQVKAIEKQVNDLRDRMAGKDKMEASFFIQRLTDIHLHSHYMLDVPGQGSAQYVNIFALVGIFILVIACINFMNLATAISGQRAKEVGLRKTLGALRTQIIGQFILESLMLSVIALGIALVLVVIMLPLFNNLAAKTITFDLLTPKMILGLGTVALMAGLLSGSYPAFFLSAFNPVSVLKGAMTFKGKKSFLRNGLVVMQFSISVILMVSTLVIYNQLQFIRNQDIGFTKENLLYMAMPQIGDLKNNSDALRAILDRNPQVKGYTMTDNIPTDITEASDLNWPGKDPQKQVLTFRIQTDENFLKTFQMKMVTGRFFATGFSADDSSFVVNETALKTMNLKPAEAIGKKITVGRRDGSIIGVVKDFNFKSVHQAVDPLVIQKNARGGFVVMRTTPQNAQVLIAQIKKSFQSIYGDMPFSYGFVNDDLSKLYLAEQRMSRLFNIFSALSVIICSLGLFGLATFATQKRTKEIGVRKVLGAGETGLVFMLAKDFIRLVIISLVIAFPVSWWLMHEWLMGFAYRSGISWWLFAASGFFAISIAIATVSYQTIRAALANPVKSLRTE